MYLILSLMMIGAMLCYSLKTSDVLEVKAAALLVPGIGTTDVGGVKEKSLMSCFFRAKIWANVLWGKDMYLRETLSDTELIEKLKGVINKILLEEQKRINDILKIWRNYIKTNNIVRRIKVGLLQVKKLTVKQKNHFMIVG